MCWAPEGQEAKAPKVIEGCAAFATIISGEKGPADQDARGRLVQLLRTDPSPQMQYQLGFCFWLLTFDQTIAEQINSCVPTLQSHARPTR